MKNRYILIFCMMIILLISQLSCTNQIELDAVRLAGLHHQKTNMILIMLKTNDSVLLRQYQEKLLLLENEYSEWKGNCTTKYTDSISKAQFEASFLKALKIEAK